jgi:hypothetical protein
VACSPHSVPPVLPLPPAQPLATACSNRGVRQVAGLYRSWSPTRPAFITSVVTGCVGLANVTMPTPPNANYQAWSFSCPAGTALAEVYWSQQDLPSGQPFLSSLAFRCTAEALAPRPAPPVTQRECARARLLVVPLPAALSATALPPAKDVDCLARSSPHLPPCSLGPRLHHH